MGYTVLPPPSATKDGSPDPISEAKVENGEDPWEIRKEVLGWIFNRSERCI